MILTRRRVMEAGGQALVLMLAGPSLAAAKGVTEIVMRGDADGSHVWFDPVGIHVQPGQTVRWTNRDPGNAHTATAYHPKLLERPLRIPDGAEPWDSDYLLPGERFSVTFTEEGVYDYYCVPHEHAGMVGRIVVGNPPPAEPAHSAVSGSMPLPQAARDGFPSVEDILAKGIVRPA